MDVVTGNYRDAPPRSPYPPYALMRNSFFDSDFRYLDDPNYVSEDFFDRFHNVHLGDDFLFGTGGQLDWRHMHEFNARLSGKTDDFDLLRARIYGDLWYKDIFRVYVPKSSRPLRQSIRICPPLKTDYEPIEFLNLFFRSQKSRKSTASRFTCASAVKSSCSARNGFSPRSSGPIRGKPFRGYTACGPTGVFDVDVF